MPRRPRRGCSNGQSFPNSTDSYTEAISSLTMMKVLRLARLARIIRALRFKAFHELKLRLGSFVECIHAAESCRASRNSCRIVMGVFSGLRVIGWAIVLLIFVIYAIGVVLRTAPTRQVGEL